MKSIIIVIEKIKVINKIYIIWRIDKIRLIEWNKKDNYLRAHVIILIRRNLVK
jgi:hypothetical protein